jgi:hypothetical protein
MANVCCPRNGKQVSQRYAASLLQQPLCHGMGR